MCVKKVRRGFNFSTYRKRFIDPKVRRMLAETQAIKHQHVKVSQRVDGIGWDLAEICQISEVVEAICHHRQPAMDNLKRRYLQFWSNAETGAGRYDIWNHFRKTASEV